MNIFKGKSDILSDVKILRKSRNSIGPCQTDGEVLKVVNKNLKFRITKTNESVRLTRCKMVGSNCNILKPISENLRKYLKRQNLAISTIPDAKYMRD